MNVMHMLVAAVTAASALTAPALGQQGGEERCPARAGTPALLPSPDALERATPYVYKSVDGVDLRVHVFEPSTGDAPAEGRPAIVMYYGSGWMGGDVTSHVPKAHHVADRGGVAILADTRTYCRNGAGILEQVRDAHAAMSWIRGHADELGVDPDRLAVFGGSAGGHIAMSTAQFADVADEAGAVSSKPDLMVLFFPCTDPTSEVEMQNSSAAIGQDGMLVSPMHHISGDLPPMYVFQGTDDPLYEQNVEYCERVQAAGAVCTLTIYEGAAHGFRSTPENDWQSISLQAMDDVLTAEGYLPAKS